MFKEFFNLFICCFKKIYVQLVCKPDKINKYISNSGICSRRDADMHISIGSVTVNGQEVSDNILIRLNILAIGT